MNLPLERLGAGEAQPRTVPRFLSCLVKGPLGCLAFVLGAAVVIVLLLPSALGRVLDRTIEDWFEEHHAGRLELSDVRLGSFYGEQRIERLILRDPRGDEVLSGDLRAPSLAEVFDDSHRFGPIVLRIDVLRLVEARDGTTNLERALAELPGASAESGRERGFSTDVPFEFELEIVVAHLRITSASGKETQLEGLNFHGALEWGPDATHLALEGGADPALAEALHARIELGRPAFGPSWTSALVLEHAPTVLARALCVPARPLVQLAGDRTDRLSWSRDGQEVALLCEDEGARFELLGEEQDGLVGGPKGSVLTATLPCANEAGRELLAALLPLVVPRECVEPDASHELRLTDYRWPLDGDWSVLAGELELALAPLRGELLPALAAELGQPAALDVPETLRASIRAGRLESLQFELPLEQGWLHVGGTLELASGLGDFVVTGERGGETIGPLRFVGPRGALARAVTTPPPLPAVPDAEVPTPPGGDG